MFGFNTSSPGTTSGYSQPWGGLPSAGAPWPGSTEVWQPAQQSPWRLSPWQTQAMPAAAPIQPIAPPPAAPAPSPYLSQGLSSGIPSFDPMVPGGGMYAHPPAAPAAPAAPATSDVYYSGAAVGQGPGLGRLTNDPFAPGFTRQMTEQDFLRDPGFARQQLSMSHPWHPDYIPPEQLPSWML